MGHLKTKKIVMKIFYKVLFTLFCCVAIQQSVRAIPGCTDPADPNYNASATVSNCSSCENYALGFNNAESATLPPHPDWDSGTFTVEAYIYPTGISNVSSTSSPFENTIVSHEHDAPGNSGWVLRLGDGGDLSFMVGDGAVGWIEASTSNDPISLNTGYHVAGTYDGSDIKVYLDGALVGSIPSSSYGNVPGYGITIGEGNLFTNRYFNGRIDEVRIWDIARTEAEINEGICIVDDTNPNLVGYYTFNEDLSDGSFESFPVDPAKTGTVNTAICSNNLLVSCTQCPLDIPYSVALNDPAPQTNCDTILLSSCIFAGEFGSILGTVVGETYCFQSPLSPKFLSIYDADSLFLDSGFGEVCVSAVDTALFVQINDDDICGTSSSCNSVTATCPSCGPTLNAMTAGQDVFCGSPLIYWNLDLTAGSSWTSWGMSDVNGNGITGGGLFSGSQIAVGSGVLTSGESYVLQISNLVLGGCTTDVSTVLSDTITWYSNPELNSFYTSENDGTLKDEFCGDEDVWLWFTGTPGAIVHMHVPNMGSLNHTITSTGSSGFTVGTTNSSSIVVDSISLNGCVVDLSSEAPFPFTVNQPAITSLTAQPDQICDSSNPFGGDDLTFVFEGTANTIINYTVTGFSSPTSSTLTLDSNGDGQAAWVAGILDPNTTYTLTVDDLSLNGCIGDASLTAPVSAFVNFPEVTSFSGSTEVCKGDNWNFLISGTPGAEVTLNQNYGPFLLDTNGNYSFTTLTNTLPAGAWDWYVSSIEMNGCSFSNPSDTIEALSIDVPTNDSCSAAISIACGDTVFGNNTCVDLQSIDDCLYAGAYNYRALWYSFIGDGSTVTASTCGAATDFNTALLIYNGDCNNLVCEAGDNSGCGNSVGGSEIIFNSIPGTVYYIAIGGFTSSAIGNFELSLNCINEGCDPFLILDNNPESAGTYQAEDYIESTSTINSGSAGDVLYKAGQSIELKNGFEADGAVDFSVEIEDCPQP